MLKAAMLCRAIMADSRPPTTSTSSQSAGCCGTSGSQSNDCGLFTSSAAEIAYAP